MARTLKRRELEKILRRYGVEEYEAGGKGSHTKFVRDVPGRGLMSYPLPMCDDVLPCYINPLRKQLGLTADDGVSDAEFFSKKKPKAKSSQQGESESPPASSSSR